MYTPRMDVLSTVRSGPIALAVISAVLAVAIVSSGSATFAQSRTAVDAVPSDAPAYFLPTYLSAIQAPLPPLKPRKQAAKLSATALATSSATSTPLSSYDQGVVPSTVPQLETDTDSTGQIGSYQPAGATRTAGNAFFQSLGTNGRSCVTCHQPPSGMSVSLSNIQARNTATGGTDPIFAPVDGANCPNLATDGVTPFATAHSLLLNNGLFRIFLPVPTQTTDPVPQPVEFTISVVSDPTGCNTNPTYNSVTSNSVTTPIISVFRRPIISSDLQDKLVTLQSTGFLPPVDLTYGFVLPFDSNGKPLSGNIMWDGREPTLQSQAIDATLGHAQALAAPTTAQVNQIVQFESGIFSAQSTNTAGTTLLNLASGNGAGGPVGPSTFTEATALGPPVMTVYNGYAGVTGSSTKNQLEASISRGQTIFNTRTINIAEAGGGAQNPAGTCSFCHGSPNAGATPVAQGQIDIGVAGAVDPVSKNPLDPNGNALNPNLPVFHVSCTGTNSTFFNGTSVLTNDPGMALISGRCSDLSRFSVPTLRALSSHPPFFHDGSAATLTDVVNFYNKRFQIGLSSTDTQDLVNFLSAL